MNLRDLMNKLDAISEAPEQTAPMSRSDYDRYKADDAAKEAREAAIKLIKSRTVSKYQVPQGMTVISKEDGKIMWGETTNRGGGGSDNVTGRSMSMEMYNQGTRFVDSALKSAIETLKLKVSPVAEKTLFGSSEVASVDLQQLADIDKPVAPVAATPATPAQQSQADATSAKVNGENIQKLNDLTYKLSLTKRAVPAAKPAAKPAASGQPAVKTQPKAPAQKTSSAMPAVDANGNSTGTYAEGIQFNGAIANALVESFGYEKLDELSVPSWLPSAGREIGNAGTAVKNWFSGFGKGVSNPRMTNLPRVADGTAKGASGAQVGAKVATNPGKVAAGSAAAGAGAVMLAQNDGKPATVEVPSVAGQEVPSIVKPPPADGGTTAGPTPEQLEIIKQMQEIMKQLEGAPEATNAISNAQEQISKITASPAQAAQDAITADRDRNAADSAPAPSIGKPGEDRMAQQASTMSPTAAHPGTPEAGVAFNQGVNAKGEMTTIKNADGSTTNPETGVVTPKAPATLGETDELARWLRIARGR